MSPGRLPPRHAVISQLAGMIEQLAVAGDLSTARALITPMLVLLDEESMGSNPGARACTSAAPADVIDLAAHRARRRR